MATRILVTGGSGFIGTKLVGDLLADGHTVQSFDVQKPTLDSQSSVWVQGNVLDKKALASTVDAFAPDYLVHLAAETEIGAPTGPLADAYPVNCCSAAILADILHNTPVKKCIMVSTQYVCGPTGRMPTSAKDTFPHTRYGESKVLLEEDTRNLMPVPWVIIRPTYVWGPHNKKNFLQLLSSVAAGRYLHPGAPAVIRSYGYVGTVSWFIRQALTDKVDAGTTIYATDQPEDSADFINRLNRALNRPNSRQIPRLALRMLGWIGDRIKTFPMNSFRYFNMTTDYPVPCQWGTHSIGHPPTDLAAAATDTAKWYTDEHLTASR